MPYQIKAFLIKNKIIGSEKNRDKLLRIEYDKKLMN